MHRPICYRVHVADIGWMPAVCNGAVAGTTGQGRDIQAIQIWSNRRGVSVCYQVHVAQLGDIPGESCDGDMAGTVGRGLSMQAIEIRVALGPSGEWLTYQAHVASIGWMAAVRDPDQAGTTRRGLGLQAITISMTP